MTRIDPMNTSHRVRPRRQPRSTGNKPDKHTLALAAALGATGVEVYCVYDGLHGATGAQLAMGLAAAILTPVVAAFMEGTRRWFAVVVFAAMLACVIVVSGSRVAGSIDSAEGQREQASRASNVARDTAQEIKGVLDEARLAAKIACADNKARTKACTEAHQRVDTLLGKWTAAGTTLVSAPVVTGEGDVARVSAWLGGYVTDRQVRLYLPLLWPVSMALAGAFFWAAWGDGRSAKPAPVAAPAIPKPIAAPTQDQRRQQQGVDKANPKADGDQVSGQPAAKPPKPSRGRRDRRPASARRANGAAQQRILEALRKRGGRIEAGSVRKIAGLIGARKSTVHTALGILLAAGFLTRVGKAIVVA
jgi:hypothetical protein